MRTMTAALDLHQIRYPVSSSKQADNLHATHTKNARQSSLCLGSHLQIPYQHNRQESQCKIANRSHHTVQVGNIDKVVGLYTASRPCSLPEERNRRALQGQHEPENKSDDDGKGDDDPENDGVYSCDSETEESKRNRHLCKDDDDNVGHLAEPPPLFMLC